MKKINFDYSFIQMNDFKVIKIHNSERLHKIENYSKQSNRRNRPHAYYKCFTYIQIPRMMKKFGYEYKSTN